jgi:hypothetical protein
MMLIALIVSLLAVGAGIAAVTGGDDTPSNPDPAAVASVTATTGTGSDGQPESTPQEGDAEETPQAGQQTPEVPTVGETPGSVTSLPELPQVAQPAFTLPINGLAHVESVYSETHEIGNFTIRWRPGAFPAERAQFIAGIAQESLATVNQKLGTNDTGPIDIFLADALFNEECWGCQGFAASDLRQVFILQDGSVGDAELPSLLTHEIGHVMVGNYIELPESLFFAEGIATWLSDDDIVANGYVSPRQTAGWALQAGVLPTIDELLDDDFAGRMRARAEYDAAASFVYFIVDTYGFETYRTMYIQSRADAQMAAQVGTGKDWQTLEQEWRAYLTPWTAPLNGVSAEQFWSTGEQIMSGYRYLFSSPESVTIEQYAALVAARLEWNSLRLDTAGALTQQANLPVSVAN